MILNLIRELKKDKTKIILLVEHKMDVVREAGRPHHRADQRHAGGRWRTGRGDRIARGAGGVPGHQQGRRQGRREGGRMSSTANLLELQACTRTSGRITS